MMLELSSIAHCSYTHKYKIINKTTNTDYKELYCSKFRRFLSFMVMVNHNTKQHDIAAAHAFQMQRHTFSVSITSLSSSSSPADDNRTYRHFFLNRNATLWCHQSWIRMQCSDIFSTSPLYKYWTTLQQTSSWINPTYWKVHQKYSRNEHPSSNNSQMKARYKILW